MRLRQWQAARRAERDAARRAKIPEYGTVPYHRYFVGVWRRNMLMLAVPGGIAIAAAAMSPYWYIRLAFLPSVVFLGMQLRHCLDHIGNHRRSAWAVETNSTLEAMKESGLYDAVDAVKAVRDGPPAPGVSRKAWARQHDDLLQRLTGDG